MKKGRDGEGGRERGKEVGREVEKYTEARREDGKGRREGGRKGEWLPPLLRHGCMYIVSTLMHFTCVNV